MHYYSGDVAQRDFHLQYLQTHYNTKQRGPDLAWYAYPLLVTLVEWQRLDLLSPLIPKLVEYLARDEKVFNDAIKVLEKAKNYDTAFDLVKGMSEFEPSFVSAPLFQPLFDLCFSLEPKERQVEEMEEKEMEATDAATGKTGKKKVKKTEKTEKKEKKAKKEGEVPDVYKAMRDMKIVPTVQQTEQAISYYLEKGDLEEASLVLADMRSYSPKIPDMLDWHTKFFIKCAEKKESATLMVVLKRTAGMQQ